MTLRTWLEQGEFNLSLSAGFFGFYSHCGFLKALWENGFHPKKISGASAGALAGSLFCAGMTPHEMEKALLKFRRHDFWDMKPGLGLLAGKKFESILKDYLPQNFSDLKTPFAASTFQLSSRRSVTFENGELISAVRASCCFPIMFQPVKIQGKRYIDGGVSDWMALGSATEPKRTLVHMLEPTGFMSGTWKKKAYSQVKSHHKVFVLPENYPMGPHRMHLAAEAIDRSYIQTLNALEK